MSRLLIGFVLLALVLFAVAVAFVIGFEVGHRRGYDRGFGECRQDVKETYGARGDWSYREWYDRAPVHVRQHRSFVFPCGQR